MKDVVILLLLWYGLSRKRPVTLLKAFGDSLESAPSTLLKVLDYSLESTRLLS